VLDWLGSVRIRKRTPKRVELELTRGTRLTGWVLVVIGVRVALLGIGWAYVLGAVLLGIGLLLATLERTLIFDRDDGLLRIEQRAFGIKRRLTVPLFHLRAVVVAMRPGGLYVAYVQRRAGGTIQLDEARTSRPLLALAEAISDVAELRMIYDVTTTITGRDASDTDEAH
jgi:hypothetical protein